jgi:hypothetical protein
MTPELRVVPSRLREVAGRQSEIGSVLSGLAVGTSLSTAAAAMSGMASGEACQLAGSVVDEFHRAIGSELSAHSGNLGVAADRYADTDAELGRRLSKFTR